MSTMQDPLTSQLANQPVSTHCPGCKGPIEVTAADALAGGSIVCPTCKKTIQLKADESLERSLRDVDDAMGDLRRTIENFGR